MQEYSSSLLIQNLIAAHRADGGSVSVSIRIKGQQIAEIGSNLGPEPVDRVIDGSGMVAIPGLVNTHHHFFQSLTRCLPGAQESGLFDWLNFHYPIWKHFDEPMMRAGVRLAIAELLLSGCTTSCDHIYLFPQAIQRDLLEMELECATELGLRFSALRGSMTLGKSLGGLPPDEIIERDEDVLRHCEVSVNAHHDSSKYSMRQVHLAPCSPFNVSAGLMRETAWLARKLGVRLHTHLAETLDENDYCLARYGKRPLALMQEWEWLGPDVWFAHGIYFDDDELDILAETQTGVAHCPSSNCRLGSGRMRLSEMLRKGVLVGLAVDGCASNDSSHMLAELRQTMLLNRLGGECELFSARKIIDLATHGSGRLLGRTDIGSLAPGMAADLALFNLNELGYAGSGDPIAALLFCAPTRPHTLIVNGRVVVENRVLLTGDEPEIAEDARNQARRLRKAAGV